MLTVTEIVNWPGWIGTATSAAIAPPPSIPSVSTASAPIGTTSKAWSSLQPLAQWLTPVAAGSTALGPGNAASAIAEDGVALPAPDRAAADFSGGRLRAELSGLVANYSVAFWFYNELPNTERLVTGYLFSRGEDGAG